MYPGTMLPTEEISPGLFENRKQTGTERSPDTVQTDMMRKEGVVQWIY